MRCILCKNKAVQSNLCKKHFIEYFENKVFETIEKHELIGKNDKILVACSGGKDSTALLYLLHKKYKNNVSALAIDEGIKNYRDKTLKDLKNFCKKHKIKLIIVSFKKEVSYPLDVLVKKLDEKPCTVCGILRRYLLNKYSRGYDLIALGHNLDDEAQAILMNILKANTEVSARLGPITGVIRDKRFTKRIKPLYFLTEKEVLVYTFLMEFGVSFNECPYVRESFRGYVRGILNEYESKHPGAKKNMVNKFLLLLPSIKKKYSRKNDSAKIGYCKLCGEPSSRQICNTCLLIEKIKKNLNKSEYSAVLCL